jgi:hypothetical protein
MKYCRDHVRKSYTEKQFDKIKTCPYSGSYQGATDKEIRVYCFVAMNDKKCPKVEGKK